MGHDRGGRPRRWRRSRCLARVGLDVSQGPRHGTRFGAGFARFPRRSWRRRSNHSGATRDRLHWYCRGSLPQGRGLRGRRRSRLRNCRGFLCNARLCNARLYNARLCNARLCNARLCDARLCNVRLCDLRLCDLRLCDLLLASRVEALAHLIGNIFIEGARMRLLVRDADLGQIVGDNLRFDFELARQLVNANFAHLCFLIL
jgi:hypothetical protein